MATNFEDSLYGFVIGGVIGDVMSGVATINNQLDLIPLVRSPKDAATLELVEGEWFYPSAMMLAFISRINDPPEEREAIITQMAGTGTTHPSFYTGAVSLYYCNNIKQSLQYLAESGSDNYTTMWVAVIDLAIHAVQKKHILNPASYASILPVDEARAILTFDGDVLPEKAIGIEAQLRTAIQAFAVSSTFVEGMIQIINYVDAPQIPSFLYGQLAGAYYGLTDIPVDWVSSIKDKSFINKIIGKLLRTPAVMHTLQKGGS